MPEFSTRLLVRAILTRIGQEGRTRIEAQRFSETLKKSLEVIVRESEVVFFIPHYWAVYHHEGSGPIRGKMMAFFRRRTDDPRTGFGTNYPVRAKDVVRGLRQFMSKEEIKAARERGDLIFTTKVGKRGGVPFFTRALSGIGESGGPVEQISRETLTEYLEAALPTDERTASLRL